MASCFLKPALYTPFPELIAAESTRLGGVSMPPYDSLNLGLYTEDDPERVRENRRRFLQAAGVPPDALAHAHQVHGREVKKVDAPGFWEGYDALVTDRPGVFLGLYTADCCPVLLYDPQRRAVGAAHAGWRGAAARVAAHTVQAMQAHYGSRPADCYAWLGACIGAEVYEVGPEVARYFPGHARRPSPASDRYLLDVKGAVAAQLREAGLPSAQIALSPYCTFSEPETFFSHRRDRGRTGRMLSIIGVKTTKG